MKMSTLLEGLRVEDITTGLGRTKYGLVNDYGIVTSKIEMESAAHVINCHDDLVGALSTILSESHISPDLYSLGQVALAKAKGEQIWR